MKSYTYKVVNWDNCPDVRVNIDVSQDWWQPYLWLRLRREFLSRIQSVRLFLLTTWQHEDSQLFNTQSIKDLWFQSSLQPKPRPGKQAVENPGKNLISPENICPFHFIIWFLIYSVQTQLYFKRLQFEDIVLLSDFVQCWPNKTKHKAKCLSSSLSFFYKSPYLSLKNVNKTCPKFSKFQLK